MNARTGEPRLEPTVQIEEAKATSPEATWCLEQYFAELRARFEGGFDVAKSVNSDRRDFLRPRGAFVIVSQEGRPVGCGGVTLTAPTVGYIKRMWIDSSCRGQGLGRRLLTTLEDAARELGCTTAQLETNKTLTSAIQLYRTAGYREVPPFNDEFYAHHWFEKPLT